jgi:hypothetical protein
MTEEGDSIASDVAKLRSQINALNLDLQGLRELVDEELNRAFREIALDRQRLARLEASSSPTPSQKDRGEILRALLVAHGGKMPVKEARHKMRLSKSQFSQLLASMDGAVETKPYRLDKRQKILQSKLI